MRFTDPRGGLKVTGAAKGCLLITSKFSGPSSCSGHSGLSSGLSDFSSQRSSLDMKSFVMEIDFELNSAGTYRFAFLSRVFDFLPPFHCI